MAIDPRSSYQGYVTDLTFLDSYNTYQAKYAQQIRESDKVLIHLIEKIANKHESTGRPLRLLDIGCSTGNLLLHIKRLIPGIEMTGGELAESSLAECRANPELSGISFERLDMLNLPYDEHFDIIVANAVAVYFYWEEYQQAARSVAKALKRGGTYLAFEWIHPFEHQDIVITETTLGHPQGLRICFRPMKKVAEVLEQAGMEPPTFLPFELPIDLPMPAYDQEVVSYTVRSAGGHNLCFRGALSQPWCHLSANRS